MWKDVNTPPERENEHYLVTDGTSYSVAFYFRDQWTTSTYFWMPKDIKHWMELPELPTK